MICFLDFSVPSGEIEVKNEITLRTAGNKKETYISNQKETVKEEPRFSSSSPRYRKSKGIYSDTEEIMHCYLKIFFKFILLVQFIKNH